jgi:putative membrane protein
MGILIDLIIVILVAAVVIWIVSKLNLGLTVDSYTSAIIAAVVIAVITALVLWLLGLFGIDPSSLSGLWGLLVTLVVAAVVLLLADRFLSGLQVKGFGGAIIAAIGIAVVGWLVNWLLGLLGIV